MPNRAHNVGRPLGSVAAHGPKKRNVINFPFHYIGLIITGIGLLDMAMKATLTDSIARTLQGCEVLITPRNNASKSELQGMVHAEDTIQQDNYESLPPTTDDSKSNNINEQCIISFPDCDLGCLDWTIILSTGRAGSTTVLEMMADLPGMHFYGEEGGLLNIMQDFQAQVEKHRRKGGSRSLAWIGAGDADVRTVACMTQKYYAERHGDTCLHRGCRHGWKEIRYTSPESIQWIRTIFPSSKLILNYRGTCKEGYKDVFGRDCKSINEMSSELLASTKDMKRVFHMETEQLSNLTRWRDLAGFLGYNGCKVKKIASANKNRSYARRSRAKNLWNCK